MIQAAIKSELTFEEFLNLELDEDCIYELIGGVVVPMAEPSGWHESLRTFLLLELEFESRRAELNFEIHPQILCKLDKKDGRRPDLIAINRQRWVEVTQIEAALYVPPELAVEIVSTNWEEDYQKKARWYAAFGVQEYWIVDSLNATKRYPKRQNPAISVPTVSIGQLNQTTRAYDWKEFTGNTRIDSTLFPNIELTAEQIFTAGR